MKILNLWERVIYALRASEPGEFGFGISRDINDLLRSIHLIYSVVTLGNHVQGKGKIL